jgi:hypothetical protein
MPLNHQHLILDLHNALYQRTASNKFTNNPSLAFAEIKQSWYGSRLN